MLNGSKAVDEPEERGRKAASELESRNILYVIELNSEQLHAFFGPFFGTSAEHPRSANSRGIFLEAIVSEVNAQHE